MLNAQKMAQHGGRLSPDRRCCVSDLEDLSARGIPNFGFERMKC
jgi:hypothetical protein